MTHSAARSGKDEKSGIVPLILHEVKSNSCSDELCSSASEIVPEIPAFEARILQTGVSDCVDRWRIVTILAES